MRYTQRKYQTNKRHNIHSSVTSSHLYVGGPTEIRPRMIIRDQDKKESKTRPQLHLRHRAWTDYETHQNTRNVIIYWKVLTII
jgi:hypothetical protein